MVRNEVKSKSRAQSGTQPRSTDKAKKGGDPAASSDDAPRETAAELSSRSSLEASVWAAAKRFCMGLKATEKELFLTDQIARHLAEFISLHQIEARSARFLERMFRGCSEIIFDADSAYAVLRPGVGLKRIIRVHPQLEHAEEVSRDHYLEVKDAQIQGREQSAKKGLVIDFAPFFRDFPKVNEAAEMGEGISFLNRHLSAQMYQNPQVFRSALLDFLRFRHLDGESILVNDHLTNTQLLLEELAAARGLLNDYPDDTPCDEVAHELRTHGFDPGWGRTVKIIQENLTLLGQVLESSEPARFERLLGRLPLIRTVVMVSPHGWFAQDAVLGRPDTGGQVTYVLDQALALEHEMRRQFIESGLDVKPKVIILTRLIPDADGTTCNVAREKIRGSEDGWIVRAPFRDERGEIVPHWISRFQIWPYLERFAEESKQVVVAELLGRPDLVIGHYTDGNLVASRLADDLKTTHCACVHALEKTKYLLSDMHWADMEKDYRFSMQFTADLIGYNSADFIISSSYREVGGTPTEMGMIESYELFSMPGLYRVRSGFNPRLARHNIVPPGASEEYFFSMHEKSRSVPEVARLLEERFLSADPADNCMGRLDDPALPPIFAMARLDKIKNLSGLVELFGQSPTLREKSNLLIVSSIIDASQSNDHEEIDEINRVKQLLEQYELEGHVRWCAARLDKLQTGEIYRLVAQRKGVFAQPALMETFGLTVIEAMACSLPVAVTCFGGPSEIVINGASGLIANPNDHAQFAAALERIVSDPDVWQKFSTAGEQRVQEAFTWRRHAERVLRMANVYDYWNYLDVMNRQSLDQYIHTLYHAVYRPRTQAMLHEAEEG